MATENELLIKIRADSDKAIKDIGDLSKKVDELTKENKKYASTEKDIKKVSDGYSKISNTVKTVAGAMASLGIAMKAVDYAKLASDAEQAQTAFSSIMQSMGLDAETEFNRIKAASEGLISDKALYEATTKAVSLGVPFEKIGDLMEVAKAKSKDMGISLTQAFEDIATGIGRGSSMILDNLGLTIKLEEGNKKYADSLGITVDQMTAQQKTMALTNQVIEASAEAITRYADAGETSAEKFQKLDAQLENTKVLIGQKLLPLVAEITDKMLKFIESLDSADWDRFENGVNTAGSALGGLMSILGKSAEGWQKVGEWLEYGYENMRLITDSGFAEEIRDISKNEDELNNILKNQGTLLEDNSKLTKKQITIQKESINAAIENNTKQMIQLEESIARAKELNEVNGFTIVKTKEYEVALSGLYEQNKKLYTARAELNKEESKVDEQLEKQRELTALKQRDAEAIKAQEAAQKKYNEEQSKLFEKNKEALDKRLSANKDTLIKLQSQEDKHKDELAKLEAELHGIRQSYANKRAALDLSVESQIANIYAKGLDDYQAYKDAQQRADVVYAQAKKAIEAGNLELAKTYLNEYNSLIAQGAGEEIAVKKKVKVWNSESHKWEMKEIDDIRVSKNQSAEEAKKDLLAGKALMEQVYNAEEQNEIALHNQKIADKKAEIELVKIQIEAQKALVAEIGKIVAMATGAKFDMDFSAVNAAVAQLDQKLAETTNKERDAKIKVTTDDKELVNLENEVEKGKLTAEIDADTKTGFTKFKKFKDGVEQPLNAPVKLVTDDTDYGNAKINIETTKISAPVTTDTSEAMSNNERMRAELSRPLPTLHQTIVQHVVQANATGGNVGIGKFATGGGYKKRRGKIPGHDLSGKDDIPSLLTRGEFVQNVRAVDYYGEAFMHAINQRAIPKEALRLADGGEVDSGASKNVNLSLMMPDNKTSFNMQTDEQIANALERYIRKYQ